MLRIRLQGAAQKRQRSLAAPFARVRAPESLEIRTLLSAAPLFADFAANSPVVFAGDSLTLFADVSDTDGTVQRVDFYRDADNDGQVTGGVDEFLSTDTDGTDGWSHEMPAANFPVGSVAWLAVAADDANDTSLATASTQIIAQLDLDNYNITPLGNSITQATVANLGYRYRFWTKLIDANYPFDLVGSQDANFGGNPDWPTYLGLNFDQDHEGHAGLRANEVLAQLPNWLTGYTPDIVLLHIGTNDIKGYDPAVDGTVAEMVETTLDEVEGIINVLRADNPNVVVMAAQLFPALNPTVDANTDLFNAALPARVAEWTTAQSPVVLVDQNTGFDPTIGVDSYDGVHPNASGEEKMAQRWVDRLAQITDTHLALSVDQTQIAVSKGRLSNNSGIITGVVGANLSATIGNVVDNGNGTWSWSLDTASQPLGWQTVTVTATDGGTQTEQISFELFVSRIGPMLLSSAYNGRVGGVSYQDEDIIRYDFDTQMWSLYFDGSDVGITGDVDAVQVLDDGSLLLSLDSTATLAGAGLVEDEDILRFVPTTLGDVTAGTFEFYFDGSDVGVTADLDAATLATDGRLVISFDAPVTVDGIAAEDKDLLVFNDTSLGADTAGTWELFMDGSDIQIGFGLDFNGTWIDGATGELFLTNFHSSEFSITDVTGDYSDVVAAVPDSLGENTIASFSMFFDGSAAGMTQRVDAVALLGSGNQPADVELANAVSSLLEATDTSSRLFVADIVVSDDGLGTNQLSLSGDDAGDFEIDMGVLYLSAGTTLDAQGNPTLDVVVEVDDATIGGFPDDAASLTITVSSTNAPPTVTADDAAVTVAEGLLASSSGTYADGDGDPLTFTASVGTVVDHGDGTWSWSYTATDGPDESQTVTITATDPQSATGQASFNLTVSNVAPTVSADTAAVTATLGGVADNTGVYADAGVDTIALAASPGAVIDNGDGTWSWSWDTTGQPEGPQTVTITATDSDADSSGTSFTVNISSDSVPSLTVDQALVAADEGQPAANSGTIADLGSGSLSASAGNIVDNGDGTWSWSFPATDGPDESQQITVTATDGDGDAASVTFDLTVNNLAPAVAADTATVLATAGGLASNTGTYSDAGVDTVTLAASLGVVSDNGDGTWSWSWDTAGQPDGSQTVTITAIDSDTAMSSTSFAVAVSGPGSGLASLLLSVAFNGTVDSVAYNDEDILEYDLNTQAWSLYFDGSDVGITGDVDAVQVLGDGSLLLSLDNTATLAGAGVVEDEDIVRFVPAALGDVTAGTFEFYFDGSDVGITGDVDAATLATDGRLVISLEAPTTVGGIAVEDKDLLIFNGTSFGADTSGTWELFMDGSDIQVEFGLDFNGVWMDSTTGELFLTNLHSSPFSITDVTGDYSDVVSAVPDSLGENTSGSFSMFFDGSEAGMTGRVDAIALLTGGPVNQPAEIELDNAVLVLHEDTDTSSRVFVADLVVTDDGLGTNQLSLAGANASAFEIDAGVLYLSGGTVLDATTNPSLDVIVEVDDASISGFPDAAAPLSLVITDIDADVQVTVDDGVTSAVAGGLLSHTIVVSNSGPDAANGVTVTDLFPDMTNLQLATLTPSGGATSSLTLGSLPGALVDAVDLPAGSSLTYVVSGLIDGSATGTLLNAAAVTLPLAVIDPNLANNTALDENTVIVPPPTSHADLTISKSVDQSRPLVGDVITFHVEVTNHGPDAATAVVVKDALPSGLAFVSATASQGAYDETAGTWNLGQVDNGVTATLQVSARVMPGPNDPGGAGSYIDDFVPAGSGGLSEPTFMIFGSDGNLYVSGDLGVLRYDGQTGSFLDVFIPNGTGGLLRPNGLVYGPDGYLYVASQDTNEVLRYDATSGAFIDVFAVPHDTPQNGGLDTPGVLAFGPDGNLYVSSIGWNPDDVLRYDGTTGAFIDRFVAEESGGMHGPWGMAFGPDGNLYVSSFHTDQVLRYDGTTGAFLDVFASGGGLLALRGLTFGPDGNLYVASLSVNEVFRYDGNSGVFIDSYATNANLSGGQGIRFGPDGNLYVASNFLNRVLRFDGLITNYAGVNTLANDPDLTSNADSVGIDYVSVDFGDAPDAGAGTYPTLAASDGARHAVPAGGAPLLLGTSIDTESEGQGNADATGDDTLDGSDDEDGVVFTTILMQAATANVDVTVTDDGTAGFLNAWIDFDQNGSWEDPGEQIAVDVPVAPVTGTQTVSIGFTVPATAQLGATFARFRLDSNGGLTPKGAAADGEVEDVLTPVIQQINQPPTATADDVTVTVAEGSIATSRGTYFDSDNDPVTLAASFGTVVDNGDGTWSWSYATTDGPDESQTVTITVTDVHNDAGQASFDLVVNNLAPAVSAASATLTVTVGDLAGNTGTYTEAGADTVTLAASLGVMVDNGDGTWNWSWDTAGQPEGTQTVTVTATDSDSDSSDTSFTVNVSSSTVPSLTVAQSLVVVDEGQSAANSGTIADLGEGSLAASIGNAVDNGDGTWSWSFATTDGPNESQQVTITATDGDGDATSITFDLTVNNVAPTVAADTPSVTVAAGDVATNTGAYGDAGADSVTLTASLGKVLDHGDGTWSWSFDTAGQLGSQLVTITATDSDSQSTQTSFTLAVDASGSPQLLLLSVAFNGTVGTVSYKDEDILQYDLATQTWSLYFDGSDVGISGDVDAVQVLADGSLLLSLDNTATLAGVGTVEDEDIVRFVPTSLGEATVGAFEMYFDGSDVGITADVDAATIAPDGRLVISLSAPATVDGIAVDRQDLLVFNDTSLGADTAGTWELFLDGSDIQVGFGLDFNGAWMDRTTGELFLTNFHSSAFSITDVTGDFSDVVSAVPDSLGEETSGSFAMFFDGSAAGMTQRVDAVALTSTGSNPVAAAGPLPAAPAEVADTVFGETTRASDSTGVEGLTASSAEQAFSADIERHALHPELAGASRPARRRFIVGAERQKRSATWLIDHVLRDDWAFGFGDSE